MQGQHNETLIKMEKKTNHINQLYIEKYKFNEQNYLSSKVSPSSINHHGEIPNFTIQELKQAEEKTDKMNSKLKSIRTLLGYECLVKSKKTKEAPQARNKDEQNPQEQKLIGLKKYVMTMRRKSQFLNGFELKEKKTAGINAQSAFLQYTDASLKFIHSFLPHQSMLEQGIVHRHKLSAALQTNTLEIPYRNLSYQSKSFTTLIPNSQYQGQNPTKSKERFTQSSINGQKSVDNEKKFVTLNVRQNPPQQMLKSIVTSEIYTNKASQLLYHGKNYKKDLFKSLRNYRETMKNKEHSEYQNTNERSTINRSNFHLPQIKVCSPEYITKPRKYVLH